MQVVSRLELPPCHPLFDTLPHSIYWACLDSVLPCWTDSPLTLDLGTLALALASGTWLQLKCYTAFNLIRTSTRNRQSSLFHPRAPVDRCPLRISLHPSSAISITGVSSTSPDRTLS